MTATNVCDLLTGVYSGVIKAKYEQVFIYTQTYVGAWQSGNLTG